ncbi:hypothetical protein ACOMHN_002628 [Nucella lapillus]
MLPSSACPITQQGLLSWCHLMLANDADSNFHDDSEVGDDLSPDSLAANGTGATATTAQGEEDRQHVTKRTTTTEGRGEVPTLTHPGLSEEVGVKMRQGTLHKASSDGHKQADGEKDWNGNARVGEKEQGVGKDKGTRRVLSAVRRPNTSIRDKKSSVCCEAPQHLHQGPEEFCLLDKKSSVCCEVPQQLHQLGARRVLSAVRRPNTSIRDKKSSVCCEVPQQLHQLGARRVLSAVRRPNTSIRDKKSSVCCEVPQQLHQLGARRVLSAVRRHHFEVPQQLHQGQEEFCLLDKKSSVCCEVPQQLHQLGARRVLSAVRRPNTSIRDKKSSVCCEVPQQLHQLGARRVLSAVRRPNTSIRDKKSSVCCEVPQQLHQLGARRVLSAVRRHHFEVPQQLHQGQEEFCLL